MSVTEAAVASQMMPSGSVAQPFHLLRFPVIWLPAGRWRIGNPSGLPIPRVSSTRPAHRGQSRSHLCIACAEVPDSRVSRAPQVMATALRSRLEHGRCVGEAIIS